MLPGIGRSRWCPVAPMAAARTYGEAGRLPYGRVWCGGAAWLLIQKLQSILTLFIVLNLGSRTENDMGDIDAIFIPKQSLANGSPPRPTPHIPPPPPPPPPPPRRPAPPSSPSSSSPGEAPVSLAGACDVHGVPACGMAKRQGLTFAPSPKVTSRENVKLETSDIGRYIGVGGLQRFLVGLHLTDIHRAGQTEA